MLQIFKYNLGFYIKSNIDKPINIIAEQLDIETNEYINPKIIASILPFLGIDYSFTTDGKYRISYSDRGEESRPIKDISYLYIESYSVFLNQVIKNTKDFLCSKDNCCEDNGKELEQANYSINLLLSYYNLATNTNYSDNNCCNYLDNFVRDMMEYLRLDILSELNTASKNDCLSNTKVSVSNLKKIASVYFLAFYMSDKWHQYSDQNLSNNLQILNDKYQYESIKKCIIKQGIELEKAEEIFKNSIPSDIFINSNDKSYILESNIEEEKYTKIIKPSDLYNITGSLINTEKVKINIISLPIIGKLYYKSDKGIKNEINETGAYSFDYYSNSQLIYEYSKLSDSASDVFLYSLLYGDNLCNTNTINKINFKINPYGYNEDISELNLISVKTHKTAKIAFNYYHIFKLLNNPLSLYNIRSIKIEVDNNYIELDINSTIDLEGFINIEGFNNKVFFNKGALLTDSINYVGKVKVRYIDNKIIEKDIIFKLVEDSKFDNIVPIFTVNSVDKDITTIEFPFYSSNLPLYADAISMHTEPVSFYFKTKEEDIKITGANSAIINNTFPRKRAISIVAGTNKNNYSKDYIIDNTKADIKLNVDSEYSLNTTITFNEDVLGSGKIKNVAWDKNVINKEISHTYNSMKNKEIYLEVYPHDRFKFNEAYLKDITFIGTFKRFNLSYTSVESTKINELVRDLENRTSISNIDNLPIGNSSFPVYFIANNLNSVNREFLSKSVYDKLYMKGVLVNLANTKGKNPMPTSDIEANQNYPDFEVKISQVEKVSPFYEIKAEILTDVQDLANVNIYARLEGKTIDGWKTFGNKYFYKNQKLTNSIEESVNGEGLKTDNQGNATFRIAYQSFEGTSYSNEITIKPLSFVEDSNIDGVYSTKNGLLVNFTSKAVIGDIFKLDVTSDYYGDIFIQSYDFNKQTSNNTITIPLSFLPQEIINKGTFYIRVIKNGVYVETVAIDNIDNRLSVIPNIKEGNSISSEYQFSISSLDNVLEIFNNTTFSDNYGIIPDIKDKQVYKISDVYVSTDNISYIKQASNTGDYVDLPLDNLTNLDKFYLKVIVYFVQDNNAGGKIIYKHLESYKIIINLTN